MHHGLRGDGRPWIDINLLYTAVLPNLCAVAHKSAARAMEVCCGRIEVYIGNQKF